MGGNRLRRMVVVGVALLAGVSILVAARSQASTPEHPVANLGALPVSGTAPVTVSFDGSLSSDPNPGGSIASWDLAFGDGSGDATGTGQPSGTTASHLYSNPGLYTATLTVTNTAGLPGSATETVNVTKGTQSAPGAPVASLNATGASALSGIHKIQHVVIVMQENRSSTTISARTRGPPGSR
ncbi:MAG: PKD domain-containing protein [Acidimicrobiales bacterium]|nr:PKD domain-containing protein [Acidimicrobiales bacterium]